MNALAIARRPKAALNVADGPDELKAFWMFVTPRMAEDYLEANTHNRKEKTSAQARYVRAMLAGDWMPTSSIIFSRSGVLLDGQNRLRSVITSGVGQWFLIIEGAEDAAQDSIDTGVRRSLSDQLRIHGEANATELGAAISQFHAYRAVGYFGANVGGGDKTPSIIEGFRILRDNPGLRESVSRTAFTARILKIPSGVAACAHYLFSQLNQDDADFFWTRLHDGEGLEKGNPILTLRNDLLQDIGALRRMHPKRKAAIIIRAWNAFRDGEQLVKLQWSPGGARPDRFPEPH